jgi:hypothetical protein
MASAVIACDKRKAFAQGSDSDEAIQLLGANGLLRLRSQWRDKNVLIGKTTGTKE